MSPPQWTGKEQQDIQASQSRVLAHEVSKYVWGSRLRRADRVFALSPPSRLPSAESRVRRRIATIECYYTQPIPASCRLLAVNGSSCCLPDHHRFYIQTLTFTRFFLISALFFAQESPDGCWPNANLLRRLRRLGALALPI